MPCHVIIETHPKPDGGFRAQVVEGPEWAVGMTEDDAVRSVSYLTLRQDLQSIRPAGSITFLHVES